MKPLRRASAAVRSQSQTSVPTSCRFRALLRPAGSPHGNPSGKALFRSLHGRFGGSRMACEPV